jgi:hypothetical protein
MLECRADLYLDGRALKGHNNMNRTIPVARPLASINDGYFVEGVGEIINNSLLSDDVSND